MVDQPLPDQVTMGLLPYLNAHALDEDYAQAAERRRADGRGQRQGPAGSRGRVGLKGALAVGAFALLAVTAALQTSQNSTSDEKDRQALVAQVSERKQALDESRRQQAALRAETRNLQADLLQRGDDSGGVLDRLRALQLKTGVTPVTGPGVEVVVDDAPNAQSDRSKVLDTDLQKLVNGLWQSGAEAVSINGERLTALSAIRHAGEAITVNYTSLGRPYRVLAIGDPDTLPARFADTSSGQTWLDLQREIGLRFTMRTRDSLRLPGTDVPQLRYANKGDTNPRGRDLS